MSGKTGILLALILSGAVLTYTVASRLSEQTIDVLVGLLCGAAAGIPVTAGLLIALTRRRNEPAEEEQEAQLYPEPATSYSPYGRRPPYPPVIVVTPQQNPFPNPYAGLLPPGMYSPGYSMNEVPGTRDFKIIGEDDDAFDA